MSINIPFSHSLQPATRLGLKGIFRTPFFLQKLVLEQVLQQVFKEMLQDGELDFLTGHYLRINISDMNCVWYFTHQQRKIKLSPRANESVTISGELNSFVQLAARCVDPDTLFFQRRLTIEGNTEMGLQIKNLLDCIDTDSLPMPLRKTMEISSKLIC